MKIGIIGCGNIGTKRAQTILGFPEDRILGLVETNRKLWPSLEQTFSVTPSEDYRTVTCSEEIEAVVISTPAASHIPLIEECLKNGKDVLCEKPLGMKLEEVQRVVQVAEQKKRVLKCGFNLRHDTALIKAHSLYQEGIIGRPYFFKATYANGAVLTNTNHVGSLMDMGSHLLDLVHWFIGKPEGFQGSLQKKEYPLDDNGFLTFQSNGLIGQIHFGFLRWKNCFHLEISGDKGAIEIVNLPKWGRQDLHLYRRVFPSGVPEMLTEFYTEDLSWVAEWEAFRSLRQTGDLGDNRISLEIMKDIEVIRKTVPIK
ncbi:MAG: Gfo/Idh/MocA family oxidoreductase [Deltaproteobacteria bacterium]|nr:Gfo/Idh/MocA family oxidoreductase [Deltaproteobacteria bacterium]